MPRINKYVKRYGLKIVKIKKVDLSNLYCQYRPGTEQEDRKIINSPHVEFAKLYYDHGISWLQKRFKDTKYYIFQKKILKIKPYVPKKKINLLSNCVPEIFLGHHRAGALLALGIKKVDVVIAVDNEPGKCKCYGKLHNVYKNVV